MIHELQLFALEMGDVFAATLPKVFAMPMIHVSILATIALTIFSYKLGVDLVDGMKITSLISAYVLKAATYYTGAFMIQTGTAVLDCVITKTRMPFSFSGPVMVMAKATTEHRTAGQSGFNQTRDTGSGDDDGDADGDHHSADERNGSHHEARKITWEKVFYEIDQLRKDIADFKAEIQPREGALNDPQRS